ncbi:hypothetical protein KC644_01770 [Candidatus Berkelbacteria bacterium]|nr:hypothetical protein [Candidatus Berkelbacteria bacterium]
MDQPTDQQLKQALKSGLNEVKSQYPNVSKERLVKVLDELIINHQQRCQR